MFKWQHEGDESRFLFRAASSICDASGRGVDIDASQFGNEMRFVNAYKLQVTCKPMLLSVVARASSHADSRV